MDKLEFTAFERMHMGIVPPTLLDFEMRDGEVRTGVNLVDATTLQDKTGILYIKRGFAAELNKVLSAKHGRKINVLDLQHKKVAPVAPWTIERLRNLEFTSVEVNYKVGKQMWEMTTTAPDDLARVQAAWSVTGNTSAETMKANGIEEKPIWFGGFRSEVNIKLKDGGEFWAWFCSPTQLYYYKVGLIDLAPEFAEVLHEIVAREEGRKITLFEPNAADPLRVAKVEQIAAGLRDVATIRIVDNSERFRRGRQRDPRRSVRGRGLLGSLQAHLLAGRGPPRRTHGLVLRAEPGERGRAVHRSLPRGRGGLDEDDPDLV